MRDADFRAQLTDEAEKRRRLRSKHLAARREVYAGRCALPALRTGLSASSVELCSDSGDAAWTIIRAVPRWRDLHAEHVENDAAPHRRQAREVRRWKLSGKAFGFELLDSGPSEPQRWRQVAQRLHHLAGLPKATGSRRPEAWILVAMSN